MRNATRPGTGHRPVRWVTVVTLAAVSAGTVIGGTGGCKERTEYRSEDPSATPPPPSGGAAAAPPATTPTTGPAASAGSTAAALSPVVSSERPAVTPAPLHRPDDARPAPLHQPDDVRPAPLAPVPGSEADVASSAPPGKPAGPATAPTTPATGPARTVTPTTGPTTGPATRPATGPAAALRPGPGERAVTGTLRGGVVAIGGETTGWVVSNAAGELTVDVAAVRDEARAMEGKPVTVVGPSVTKDWPERGKTEVLVVREIGPPGEMNK